ncbi:MAG TPA: hypothetical protein VGF39_11545 [Stellaceae bacterium]|jgi:hypothetical protein
MQIHEITIHGTAAFSPLLSLAVTVTSGEIHVAGVSDGGSGFDFAARPSSPLFNAQNTGATLSAVVVDTEQQGHTAGHFGAEYRHSTGHGAARGRDHGRSRRADRAD